MTPEGKVVAAIRKAVRELDGEVRKMEWVAHAGAPDLCILFPCIGWHVLVEVKAPGKKPEPHQLREHEKLRKAGFTVWVCDDAKEFVRGLVACHYGTSARRRVFAEKAQLLWEKMP